MKVISHLSQLANELLVAFSEVFFKKIRRNFTKSLIFKDLMKLGIEEGDCLTIPRGVAFY
jgi:hypothetical protein